MSKFKSMMAELKEEHKELHSTIQFNNFFNKVLPSKIDKYFPGHAPQAVGVNCENLCVRKRGGPVVELLIPANFVLSNNRRFIFEQVLCDLGYCVIKNEGDISGHDMPYEAKRATNVLCLNGTWESETFKMLFNQYIKKKAIVHSSNLSSDFSIEIHYES